MSKFLRNRWLRWTLVLGVLIALGRGIYHLQEPTPICEIKECAGNPVCFVGDRMVTLSASHAALSPFHNKQFGFAAGPLQIWDVRTGKQIESHLADTRLENSVAISCDDRYFAGEIIGAGGKRTLIVFDIQQGVRRDIDVASTTHSALTFTRGGAFLIRVARTETGRDPINSRVLRIYESATGKLIAERESYGFVSPHANADDAVLHYAISDVGVKIVEVLNPRDGKTIATFPKISGFISVSDDGEYLLSDQARDRDLPLGVDIWHVRTAQLESSIKPENVLFRLDQRFSPDGRWFATTNVMDDGVVRTDLRELPSGKPIGPAADCRDCVFSPDCRWISSNPTTGLQLLEAPAMNALWKIDERSFVVEGVFSRDSQTMFFLVDDPPEIHCVDSATGSIRRIIPLLAKSATTTVMTPDHRMLLVQCVQGLRHLPAWMGRFPWLVKYLEKQRNDTVLVLETDTCRPRVHLVGWNASSAWISNDGRTLVTLHIESEDRRVLRCWNVDAWKPMYWTIGVPVGLGALMGALALWRGRRQMRKGKVRSLTSELILPPLEKKD